MKAYLIDATNPKNNGIKEINNWEEIAPLLNCDMFDVTKIEFEETGTKLNVYVDDNGVLKDPEDIVWSAFKFDLDEVCLKAILAGNLLIMNSDIDEEGTELDLTEDQIQEIEDHLIEVTESKNNPATILVV
jgi:hypothetical protein